MKGSTMNEATQAALTATYLEFYASCPEGFESALDAELRAMGLRKTRRLKGRVTFTGTVADAYRACLWSRLASRVFVVLGRFDCWDANALYDGAYDMPWESILVRGASIAVTARGSNKELRNSHYAALCVKDAICDRLADEAGARANVDTEHPDARIALSIRGERASIHLDLSGEPLFKRLPREATRSGAKAHVLRPDYAALMLAQTGWSQTVSSLDRDQDSPAAPALVDLSCAGGGLELEAISQLIDRAPGLLRQQWGFTGWQRHDEGAWNALIAEADGRAEAGRNRRAVIIATDADPASVSYAARVLRSAGMAKHATLVAARAEDVLAALKSEDADTISLLADTTEVPFTQTAGILSLITKVRAACGCSQLVALTRDDFLSRSLNLEPSASILVKPNNEEAHITVFSSAESLDEEGANEKLVQPVTHTVDLGDGKQVAVLVPESDQFAARLKKVARLRRKWAKRAGVTCYRVYDADLPDYAAAIDLYQGSDATPGRWLVIAEYAAPKTVDPSLARARLLDILTIAPIVLDVDPDHVYAKARTRSRGGSQYADAGRSSMSRSGRGPQDAVDEGPRRRLPRIQEGGLTFLVNFDDYLDTGIFLDHRVTRDLVREHARGKKRFLNLFAYTGTATCYAADGGVEETVTVDLSNTYLDWADRNMRLNGFTGRNHEFVRADVRRWISEQRETRNRWDLIFCDPPTFSNSSKMGNRTFDVQRDHTELIIGLSRLLTRQGEAIFSCNLRTFKPDIEGLARAGVVLTDITAQTIPEDFARNPRIHKCYLVKRYTVEEAMQRAGIEADPR